MITAPAMKELNNSKSLIARGTDGLRRITMFGLGYSYFYPFHAAGLFLYPSENIKKLKVFWYFQKL